MYVVLPTSTLVDALAAEQGYFEFYQEGVRGVIKDMVLNADLSKLPSYENCGGFVSSVLTKEISESILNQYWNSPYAVRLFVDGRTDDSAIISIILDYLDECLAEMFRISLKHVDKEISNKYSSWVGNNLVIKLE